MNQSSVIVPLFPNLFKEKLKIVNKSKRRSHITVVFKVSKWLENIKIKIYQYLNFSSSIEGLDKYAEAIAAGLNGEDCDLKYDQCSQYMAYF